MPLGWKWITSLLVLLLHSVIVVLRLPKPEFQASRTFLLYDEELQRHLNLSSSIVSFITSCEKFLLEEGNTGNEDITTESEMIPVDGWSGVEWYYSWAAENDLDCHLQHQEIQGDEKFVGEREATFSVKDQTTHHEWLEWSTKPLKPSIHVVDGLLVLKNFSKSVEFGMNFESVHSESATELKPVDLNQMLAMQSLKIFLKGVGIVGRRLCMTGCAHRNDQSFRIDCGFILKASTRKIQAHAYSFRSQL